jgi:transcriptional regulator with XRE-family HTH domain
MRASHGSTASGHDPSWHVDRHVGRRLRARRLALGLTQQQMAGLIGVTYQQAQKYETGANRMTAERLFTVAQALGVNVDYFFERLDGKPPAIEGQTSDELVPILAAIARDHPEIIRAVMRTIAPTGRP